MVNLYTGAGVGSIFLIIVSIIGMAVIILGRLAYKRKVKVVVSTEASTSNAKGI